MFTAWNLRTSNRGGGLIRVTVCLNPRCNGSLLYFKVWLARSIWGPDTNWSLCFWRSLLMAGGTSEIASVGRTLSPCSAEHAGACSPFCCLISSVTEVYSTKSGGFSFLAAFIRNIFLSHEYLASYSRDVLRNVCRSLCKVSGIVNRFYSKLNVPTNSISSFQCHLSWNPVRQFWSCYRQTDGRTDAMKLIGSCL